MSGKVRAALNKEAHRMFTPLKMQKAFSRVFGTAIPAAPGKNEPGKGRVEES